jgi:hypothetical protein
LSVLRRATMAQRLRAGLGYSRSMIALSRAALRRRRPELTTDEAALAWVEQCYGKRLADAVRQRRRELAWDTATNSSTL